MNFLLIYWTARAGFGIYHHAKLEDDILKTVDARPLQTNRTNTRLGGEIGETRT